MEERRIKTTEDSDALQTVEAILNQLTDSYNTKLRREKREPVISVRRNLKRKTPPKGDEPDLDKQIRRIQSLIGGGNALLPLQIM